MLSELKEELILSLKAEGYLKSQAVEQAFRNVPRENFLWEGTPAVEAYIDEPVPLGRTGQTISAPHMVALMLEELDLSPGQVVLEIGGGSGYNAALMGYISSARARKIDRKLVYSVERNHDLVGFATHNIKNAGLSSVVEIIEGDGTLGYPEGAVEEIYDRILVAAGAPRVPILLKKQLKADGIMEIPVGDVIYQKLMKVRKTRKQSGEEIFTTEKLVDCMFVPLVGEDAHRM